MSNRRNLRIVTVLVVVYLFYLIFWVPGGAHRSEIGSGKLQLARELELNSNWKEAGLNFRPNKKASLPVESTLRQQLSYQFPYEPSKPMPNYIWQTWKVDLSDPAFPEDYRAYQETWHVTNPDFKHVIIADESCEELVKRLFAAVPDVAEAYFSMPKNILKADFFRYLILLARGGLYTDIDTVSLKPIDTWISSNETYLGKPNDPGLIVGVEADPDRPDWEDWYARRLQLCQWTIQAKPGHPMLRELVANITEITLARKKKGQLNQILGKDSGGDIMNWTGPGIWTDSVFNYMNNVLQSPENFKRKQYDEIVTWAMFTGMQMPITVDDVMILPITSFSPDVNQMGAGTSKHHLAYARHMFSGSWKGEDTFKPT